MEELILRRGRESNEKALNRKGSKPLKEETLTHKNGTVSKYITSDRQVNPLRLAWVNLLSRYEWTWFTTLTFRDLPKSFTAVNRVKKWLAAIQKDEKRPLGYFWLLNGLRPENAPIFIF